MMSAAGRLRVPRVNWNDPVAGRLKGPVWYALNSASAGDAMVRRSIRIL